jgi:hypothetical protein
MDEVTALHTAGRRRCAERVEHWRALYAELERRGDHAVVQADGRETYTTPALGIFPRYNVLEAIRSEIERFVPSDFDGPDECRGVLALSADTAQSAFTRGLGSIEQAAQDDERRRFAEWARTVVADTSIAALPFRRVLGESESKDLVRRLDARWGHWYGGCGDRTDAPPTLTLWSHWFEEVAHFEALREAILSRGIERVLELREWGDSFESDVRAVEFRYTGAEGSWTAGDMSWMVQASHEASITFGGDRLIDAVKRACPDWELGQHAGWSDSPPRREP